MLNENEQNELMLNEVGYLAKLRDNEMTIFERMKIKNTTKHRIIGAITIYSVTMALLTLIL